MMWNLSEYCGTCDQVFQVNLGEYPEYKFKSVQAFNPQGVNIGCRDVVRGQSSVNLYRLRDVYVGQRGLIFDKMGRIFKPRIAPFHEGVANHPERFKYVTSPMGAFYSRENSGYNIPFEVEAPPFSAEINGPVFMASSYWEQAYTHVMLEFLPSVLIWKQRLKQRMPLLLSQDLYQSRSALFSSIGINSSNVITKEKDKFVFVRELWVCDYPRFTSPETANSIKLAFEGVYNNADLNSSSPIYLARHDGFAWDRYILNEKELIAGFEKRGVEVYNPSAHSFEDQLKKIWSSRLIIGQYGGAIFTTLLGMKNKNNLILCSENYNRFDYDGVAALLGHNSTKIICHSFESRRDPNNSPMFVNERALWQILDGILPHC